MNEMPMYIAAGMGAMLILLGFAALLTQRIYLDLSTLQPIEMDVPILGKMKANYPALVFVFLGCALTIYGVNQQRAEEVVWQIDGTLEAGAEKLNWQDGQLSVFPSKFEVDIDQESGKFKIRLPIEKGKTLEQVVQRIDYSHPSGSVIFHPKEEFERHKASPSTGALTSATDTTRTYKVRMGLVQTK